MPHYLRLIDIFRISVRRVFRQRRRYLGPASAIFLGTAGLIVVMCMRGDIKKKANENLDLLGGATILQVYYDDKPLTMPWTAKQRFFWSRVIKEIELLPGVRVVSTAAIKNKMASVGWGAHQSNFNLVAVDEYFWKLHSFTPVDGAFFDKDAVEIGERVCVIGADVARFIFGHEKVAGHSLIIDSELYRIAAVLGGFRVAEGTRYVFTPLTTALSRSSHMTLPVRLFVRCNHWEDVKAVAAGIPKAVGKYLHTDRLRVDGVWDNLERVIRVAYWIELFANVCVIATLILGGIGIWNIQMAAVRSRTREIGIKKAVGAENRDILFQFLIECLSLSFGSVLMGIVLGWLALEVVSSLLDSRPPFDLLLQSVVWSVIFAFVLGVVAGAYPAMKASRLEVASSLRYE